MSLGLIEATIKKVIQKIFEKEIKKQPVNISYDVLFNLVSEKSFKEFKKLRNVSNTDLESIFKKIFSETWNVKDE